MQRLGAEERDRLADHDGDMRRVVAMDERAEAGKLRRRRSAAAPAASCRRARLEAGRREVLQHAGVLEDEGHVRAGSGERGRAGHLRREHLQVEAPAVVGQPRDVAPERRIAREIRRAPRSDRAGSRASAAACARRAPAGYAASRSSCGRTSSDGEVGIGDDRVRPAGLPRGVAAPRRTSSSKRSFAQLACT